MERRDRAGQFNYRLEGERLSAGRRPDGTHGFARLIAINLLREEHCCRCSRRELGALDLNFTVAAAYPDVRILEYRGLEPVNSLDVVVGAIGISATSTSGAVITKNAIDLLVGANVVWTTTSRSRRCIR